MTSSANQNTPFSSEEASVHLVTPKSVTTYIQNIIMSFNNKPIHIFWAPIWIFWRRCPWWSWSCFHSFYVNLV